MYNQAPEAGLASLLASRGRNGDSVLVHMTPGELHGLQNLALAAGGQLTINPDTGLYEANFLKKLLPTILGFGLNFLFPGLGALGSSLLVGGVEAARTGDLSKGLMAGLGAYGGAGLGSALSTAGAQTAKTAAEMTAANAANVGGTAGGAAAGFVPGGVQAGMTVADAASKALAPEVFKTAATAPVTSANLNAGLQALKAAPGTTLSAVGSRLGAAGVAGLGSTASNLMTPEFKPYDPEDPMFYISGGYDPNTGFKPGYFSKTYRPFGTPQGMAGGGMVSFAEGGNTNKPLSAANTQYQGTDAEKLRQYMQALNQSFIPPPPPPPPPPAAIAPPGAGGNYVAGSRTPENKYSAMMELAKTIKFGNLGEKISQKAASNLANDLANQYAYKPPSGYSKPLYLMTAQEKAAEDAAMAAKNTAAQAPAISPFAEGYSPVENLQVQRNPMQPTEYGIGSFDQNFDRFGNEYNFGFAKGGMARRGRKKRRHKPVAGKMVNGSGDGMSDNIRANIGGSQEARLADGEFVIPADVVSHLGNGSSDAGSKKLYAMMNRVRKARTGRSQQAPEVNVDGMMPS